MIDTSTPMIKYVLPAFMSWMEDNGMIPHLKIFAIDDERLKLPFEYLNDDGSMVLNISSDAVLDMFFEDDALYFSTRFNRKEVKLVIPWECLELLYDKKCEVVLPLGGYIPEPELVEDDEVALNDPEGVTAGGSSAVVPVDSVKEATKILKSITQSTERVNKNKNSTPQKVEASSSKLPFDVDDKARKLRIQKSGLKLVVDNTKK